MFNLTKKPENQFLQNAIAKAKKNPQIIVFPEADIHELTLKAAVTIAKQKIAYPTLLGDPTSLTKKIKEINGKVPNEINIIDYHEDTPQKEYYTAKLLEIRKEKGLTEKEAIEKMNTMHYFGIMMLQENHAHALISGATCKTADTVKPAFEIIKPKEKFHKVSGFFFMLLEEKTMIFADCAININPTAEELAMIGIDSANTALRFGLSPKVAFLSFSTQGKEGTAPEIDKVKQATEIAKKQRPDLIIEGEMQVDASIVPSVARIKYPKSKIAGHANVLIFPDLNSGNIAYKLVERLAGAKAIGPILQGLSKPVNDLSRGCSLEDIVNLAAISSVEAQNETYN